MEQPLVTHATPGEPTGSLAPSVLILFNERSGPAQVVEIVSTKHAFVEAEVWETEDEQGRAAWLLALACETATAEELIEVIGSRLPDYIQARRFPPSLLPAVRRTGTRLG